MENAPVPDTRTRILATAKELFGTRGYKRTTLQAIAHQLDISKATVLYHFPSKDHILGAVMRPLIDDLHQLVERAAGAPADQGRTMALEGWLDVLLRHREWLRVIMHDVTLLAEGPVYLEFLRVVGGFYEIVAGPDADFATQVWAIQMTAMLSDPVIFFPDVPAPVLREQMLAGVRHLLALRVAPVAGDPPTVPLSMLGKPPAPGPGQNPGPSTRRRRSGRPTVMTPDKLLAARRMYQEDCHSIEEIAARLGVSRATLYRHLRPE